MCFSPMGLPGRGSRAFLAKNGFYIGFIGDWFDQLRCVIGLLLRYRLIYDLVCWLGVIFNVNTPIVQQNLRSPPVCHGQMCNSFWTVIFSLRVFLNKLGLIRFA